MTAALRLPLDGYSKRWVQDTMKKRQLKNFGFLLVISALAVGCGVDSRKAHESLSDAQLRDRWQNNFTFTSDQKLLANATQTSETAFILAQDYVLSHCDDLRYHQAVRATYEPRTIDREWEFEFHSTNAPIGSISITISDGTGKVTDHFESD